MRHALPALLVASALLAACGGGASGVGPTPTPCPAASGPPDPGVGTALRGFVFEGEGTDGAFSGRPVPCARVVLVTAAGSEEFTTDSNGFFRTDSTPTDYTLHVFPSPQVPAPAVSVFDARTASTGQVVRVYLPLNRPAGSPARDPGGGLEPAVTGRLVDGEGNPQVGSYPAGGTPGEPGTTGFVWLGGPAGQSSGRWVDSGITDSSGRFTVWVRLGGERAALTRPLFAGNYDGRREGGDVLHYSGYTFVPAVDLLSGRTVDLGTVTVRPVDAEVTVRYDAAAREVLAGWGPNGLGFTYLLASPSVAAGPVEFARVFTGPYRGGIATEQRAPAPAPLASGAPGTWVLARSFAFDATVTDNTGELSVTEALASGQPAAVNVSFLAPPRNFSWQAGSRTFTWTSLLEAGGYEVYVHDAENHLVWVGVRGRMQNSAALPFQLQRGGYYAYVRAVGHDAPPAWLAGLASPGGKPQAGASRFRRASLRPLQAGQVKRESYSRTLVVTVP